MRILTLLFLIFFHLSGYTQPFEINYVRSSNTIRVNYTGCEICLLGTSDAVRACECAEECTNDEELLTELEECRTICYEDYGMEAYDYNLLRDCNDNCETSYAYRLARCRKSSGSFSPVRAIRSMDYILFADWAVLGVDPRLSEANRVSSDWLSVDGPDVVIPPFQVPAPWPDVHDQRNVCYGIQVRIFYDDGAVCTGGPFWNCIIRG